MDNEGTQKSVFIKSVIDKCLDPETLQWKTPTRETLVFILQGLDKEGVETRNKPKKEVFEAIDTFIKQSDVDAGTKKHAHDLFDLFATNYMKLVEGSIQIKNKELTQQIQEKQGTIKTNEDFLKTINNEWGTGTSLSLEQQQAKIDAEKAYAAAVSKGMDKQFPDDKKIFATLRKELATKMEYRVDTTGQVVRYFPEIDMSIKEADFSPLLEDKEFADEFLVKYKAEDILSSLKGTEAGKKQIICIRKKAFGYSDATGNIVLIHPKMKTFLDTQHAMGGFEANVKGNRKFREYLATLVGEEKKYNPVKFDSNNIVYRLEMEARSFLGWNFENESYKGDGKYGTPGDRYLNIDGKYIDKIQFAFMYGFYQELNRYDSGKYDASLALVAGGGLSRA